MNLSQLTGSSHYPLPPGPAPATPYPLLCAKLAICHQVDLVGKVHGPCQFDEQVNAEAIAALRHRVACCGQLENSISGLPISPPSTLPHSARHSRLPGDVSLGPVQITFLTGSPLTVNSSLHVPSLSVGLTYTKGSWWIVTIWGKDKNQPGPPALGCPQGWLLSTPQPLVSIFLPVLSGIPTCALSQAWSPPHTHTLFFRGQSSSFCCG